MKCRRCHAELSADALFCPRCGTEVQRACKKCGNIVSDSDLFCHRCGAPLEHFNPIQTEKLIKVAKAISHHINNALSIVLTNSQLATSRIADLPPEINADIQEHLQDIATTADNGGGVIRQFQKFLNSLDREYPEMDNSTQEDQIVSSLQIPAKSEQRVFRVSAEENKPALVGQVSVLIVDDEEKIRHALSYALTLSGHHVITASDGREALAQFQSKSYDIAFVDLKMPGISGWEVARAIKQIDSNAMVVLMTGWGIQKDDNRLRENHVDAMITKPFELSQINNLVTAVGSSASG